MDDQQSDKNYEKIFDLIQEEIKKWLIKYPIKKLEDLLNEMAKNVKEKANLSKIEGYITLINLYCNKDGNETIGCGYHIKTRLYSNDKVIECHSDTQNSSYKIECISYNSKSFDLPDSLYFIQGIKNSILDIYDILKPGVLNNLGNQYIDISAVVSMDPNKPIKKNPEIIKDIDAFRYNNGIFNIEMTWHFDDPKIYVV